MKSKENKNKSLEELQNENKVLKKKLESLEGRNVKIKSTIKTIALGKELNESLKELVNAYPNEISKDKIANLLIAISNRISKYFVWGLILAFLPILLLIIQSFIFSKQTKLIENQNSKIEADLNLSEASRRNSFISSVSIIYDILDDSNNYKQDSILKTAAVRKISSIIDSYKPYKYYENGKLTTKELSPEKGQILRILLKQNLPDQSLFEIFKSSRLIKTEMRDARIENGHLAKAILIESDLSLSTLSGVNMERVLLESSNLYGANISGCNLMHSNFNNCVLDSATFTQNIMIGTLFIGAKAHRTDFSNSVLVYAKFDGADLTNAIFDKSIVGLPNWFEMLDKNNVIGAKELIKNYEIDPNPIIILKKDLVSHFIHNNFEGVYDQSAKVAFGSYIAERLYYIPDTIIGYESKFRKTTSNTR